MTADTASVTAKRPLDLGAAFDSQHLLLGEYLVQRGLVTEQQVQQAMDVRLRSNTFIGQILVDLGFIRADVIGPIIASRLGVSYIDLLQTPPDPEAVALVREDVLRATRSIPVRFTDDTVEVAMVDPLNVAAIDRLTFITARRVIPLLTMAGEFQTIFNDLYDAQARTTGALHELEAESAAENPVPVTRAVLAAAAEAPIVRLVDSIIESALALNASDLHFEPGEQGLRVRYRVDGVLIQHTNIPANQIPAVTARLKVLCSMDVTENRRPQDGRMRYDHHGTLYDIRASSVRTVFGEKVVLRILDQASVLVPLARLGLLPEQQKRLDALILQPHGMVLVVGPTGSGKSTTLYSSLNLLNDSKRNIMTLEDPVEYNVAGLNQVQANPKLGLTFASGLRTFDRQDPDVILVGEIRDQETAEMAVQASLTGHLLLSTLHTNSAVGTVTRLTNLGLDPFLVSQALTGVVSQRLCARICSQCAEDYEPRPEVLEAIGLKNDPSAPRTFRRGRGCRACHGRGVLGRIGVFEVLVVDEDIRRLIMRQASEDELQACAEANGMMSLREAALHSVRNGVTTPEEMGRVVLTKVA
jgi:type IV pilus assembly protein PilB